MIVLSTYTVGIWDTLWPFVFVGVITVLFYVYRHQIRQSPLRKWLPILMLGLLIVYDINYFVTIALIFSRDLQITMENLPLHLCGSSSILIMLFLIFRKEGILDILILQGIIGAIVTFIFPDITETPPTYAYLRFFLAHAILFLVPVYYIIVEEKRINKKNLVKGLIFLHILGIIAIIVNLTFDTHYMYITPNNTENLYAFLPVHELIPFLGKWPGVLLFGELLAIPVYFAVYFLIRKLQALITYRDV